MVVVYHTQICIYNTWAQRVTKQSSSTRISERKSCLCNNWQFWWKTTKTTGAQTLLKLIILIKPSSRIEYQLINSKKMILVDVCHCPGSGYCRSPLLPYSTTSQAGFWSTVEIWDQKNRRQNKTKSVTVWNIFQTFIGTTYVQTLFQWTRLW